MQSSYLLSLAGGLVIGLSVSLLLVWNGRVAGISGILGTLLGPGAKEVAWRATFLVGLVAAGAFLGWVEPELFAVSAERPLGLLIAAGVLVGFGTQLGSGCTSGHGVCGLSRWSGRSLAATLTFMATGAATVAIVHRLFGVAP